MPRKLDSAPALINHIAQQYKMGQRTFAVNTRPFDLTPSRKDGLFSLEMLTLEEVLTCWLPESFSRVVVVSGNGMSFANEETEQAAKDVRNDDSEEYPDDDFAALINKEVANKNYALPKKPQDVLETIRLLLDSGEPVAIIFLRPEHFLSLTEFDPSFLEGFEKLMDQVVTSDHLLVFLVSDLSRVHLVVSGRDELVHVERGDYNQESYEKFLHDMRRTTFPSIDEEEVTPLAVKITERRVLYRHLYRLICTCAGEGTKLTVDVLEAFCGEAESRPKSEFEFEGKTTQSLDDVKGLSEVKEDINRMVILQMKHPEWAKTYQVRIGGGILLAGPPGTGKTMIAGAIAKDLGARFFYIKVSTILTKFFGDAEQRLAALFEEARKAPFAVIFFDELDALAPKRSGADSSGVMQRVVAQLLTELQGLLSRGTILVLGATNTPWTLDPAIMRPGRFDRLIYVGLPDKEARYQILESKLAGVPHAGDFNFTTLADRASGYSGADIAGIIDQVKLHAFERACDTGQEHLITMDDVLSIIETTPRSVTQEQIAQYEEFERNHGTQRGRRKRKRKGPSKMRDEDRSSTQEDEREGEPA